MNSLAVTAKHLLRKVAQATPRQCVFIQNMSRCSSKGPSKYVVKDRRCQPIEMSFNSYETPSPGTPANPVIIMHGNVSLNPSQPLEFPIPPPSLHRSLRLEAELAEHQQGSAREDATDAESRLRRRAESRREPALAEPSLRGLGRGHSRVFQAKRHREGGGDRTQHGRTSNDGVRAQICKSFAFEWIERSVNSQFSSRSWSRRQLSSMCRRFRRARRWGTWEKSSPPCVASRSRTDWIRPTDGLSPTSKSKAPCRTRRRGISSWWTFIEAPVDRKLSLPSPGSFCSHWRPLTLPRFDWKANVAALDNHFTAHIARFPESLVKNGPRFTAPILFIGGSKSDYLTLVFPSAILIFTIFWSRNFVLQQTKRIGEDPADIPASRAEIPQHGPFSAIGGAARVHSACLRVHKRPTAGWRRFGIIERKYSLLRI